MLKYVVNGQQLASSFSHWNPIGPRRKQGDDYDNPFTGQLAQLIRPITNAALRWNSPRPPLSVSVCLTAFPAPHPNASQTMTDAPYASTDASHSFVPPSRRARGALTEIYECHFRRALLRQMAVVDNAR